MPGESGECMPRREELHEVPAKKNLKILVVASTAGQNGRL